jgi:hypothetical protein
LQAGGGAKHAAKAAHVFAQDDDAIIAPHLQPQAVIDRLDDVHLWHRVGLYLFEIAGELPEI